MVLLNNMSIGTRLIAGFCIMLFLVLAISGVSLYSSDLLSNKLEQTLDKDARLAEVLSSAFAEATAIESQ